MDMPAFYDVIGFEAVKVFARNSSYGYVCFDTISQGLTSCPYHTPLGDVFLFIIIGLLGSIFMSSLVFGLWVEVLEISLWVNRRYHDRFQNYERLPDVDLEENSVSMEDSSTGRGVSS